MCLAVPGRILEVDGTKGRVEFNGISREADLTLLPGAVTGDYVLVHAGFAIQKLDEAEAQETLKLFGELAEALEKDDRRSDDGAPAERGCRPDGSADGESS